MKPQGKRNIETLTMLLPWILTFAVFWLYPLAYSAYLSMTKYTTLTGEMSFIGFENYSAVFADPVFYKSLANTIIFTVGTVPLTAALALFLAVLLNSRLARWREFFRASFFMPSVTSMVVLSLIFNNLYSKSGYINSILSMIGAPFPDRGWLLEPSTALMSIMGMDIWISAGYYMVLFLAGMQAIPDDLYDSARLAGASPWQTFWRITFPMLRNTTMLVIVINTIKAFQVFIEIFVMTKGGPLDATSTLVYQVYSNAFEKMDMFGYASALAYVVFAVLLAMSLVQMKLLRAKD